MAASTATRFAVLDEKLSNILLRLSAIEKYMNEHAADHQKISAELAKQELVNKALFFVAGGLFTLLLGIILALIKGWIGG